MKLRLYIIKETEKAYLLKGINFEERWISKKLVKIIDNTERTGIYGKSYEMEIERWVLLSNI